MKVIDSHCDLLSKMLQHSEIDFKQESVYADVSFPRLHKAGMALQFFAVYLSEHVKPGNFQHVLAMIDLFYSRIAAHSGVVFVKSRSDWTEAAASGKLGALLALEGSDGLEANLTNLRIAYHLGVRSLGITWNYANWAADGVLEERGGGFTTKGKQLVTECNRLGMLLDVSHLSDKGFWELIEMASLPFVASHSNSYTVCPNPRNLKDDQIKAIASIGGMIGLNFVPRFVKPSQPSIKDLLLHIDYISSLGAAKHIGFGSDFDGIEQHIPGLEHSGQYERLANELYKRYKPEEADAFLFGNWNRFLLENLP